MPSFLPCGTWVLCKTRSKQLFFNLAIFGIFFLWTLLALPCVLALIGASPLRGMRTGHAAREAIAFYARTLFWLLSPFIPVQCFGASIVKQHSPCILVANHQSFLDLYLLSLQDERNLCMLTKAWPFNKLFFFAPIMRMAGYIDVESLSPAAALALCQQRIAERATLIVFPEGKRTRDGSLGKFHAGAFHLAMRENIPVVPMVIEGSYQVFRAGALCFCPQPIVIRYLPPVFPHTFRHEDLPHRCMMRHVRQQFVQALAATA